MDFVVCFKMLLHSLFFSSFSIFMSDTAPLIYGVPQGSALKPISFYQIFIRLPFYFDGINISY